MRLTERLGLAWRHLKADLGGVTTALPWDDVWYSSNHGYQTATGLRISPESALRVAAVFACTRVTSETCASCPAIVYRRLPNGGKERATDHPLYDILHYRPNQWQTAFEWIEMMQGHLELRGNAFAVIEPGPRGAIDALIPVHPDRVQVSRLSTGRLQYKVTFPYTAQSEIYTQDEMFHLRGWSSDGLVGMSTVAVGAETIACGLASQEFAARFFSNSATPSGVFTAPKALNDKQYERYEKSIREAFSGVNAHKAMVLEEGMDWKAMGISSRDSQLLEARQFSRADIASMFRVPPHKIGDLTRATFCLPGDAQVSTEFGPKAICDIKVGDKVWSMDAKGELVLNSVKRSACTGEDRILTIRTMNRTLRCNAKHKILVRREVQEEYKGGRGKYHTTADGWKYRTVMANEYVPAGDLRLGDQLVAVNEIPEQHGTKAPTREATVPFMEVLGMLLGDGFYAKDSRTGKGSTFGISHAEDAEFMPYYVAQIESLFQRRSLNHSTGDRALRAVLRDKNTTVFYSTAAYEELEACGFVGTAKTKQIPEWVFGLSNDLKLGLIRGYLDADGTVQKDGHHARFASVNREMLDQVRHLCISAGIHVSNMFSSELKSEFEGYGEYTHVLWGFLCSNVDDLVRLGTHTAMYQERIAARLASRRKRVVPVYPCESKLRCDFARGMHATPIQTIETSTDIESVYDLEVNKDHNFIADGVIVSNSNIEQQNIEFATDCIRARLVRFERRIHNDLIAPLDLEDGNEYFCQFDMDAQLRGDMKSRYESYAVGRQWGWLSANDICSMENRNPLPKGGDEYLRPLNMVAAGTTNPDLIDQGLVQEDSTATGSAALPGSRQKQLTDGKVATARLKEFAQNAAERVVRREINALRKIMEKSDGNGAGLTAVDEFYRTHEDFVAEAMCIDHATAGIYIRHNRALFFSMDSEAALSELYDNAADMLASLALDEKERAPAERPIHITMPAQTINVNPTLSMQPMEMKVNLQTTGPAPTKSVRVLRDKVGRVDSLELESDKKQFVVKRGATGLIDKIDKVN